MISFSPSLVIGQTVGNQELASIFGCGTQGGMRRAHKTNSLVLISNHVESIYDDRWLDGNLHYTGMGREGDQSLGFMQNKTLAESQTNGVSVFLFEVFQEQQYSFSGPVELVGEPYSERQPDSRGNDRQVWIFPLGLRSVAPMATPIEKVLAVATEKARKARRLADADLLARAARAHRKPGRRSVEVTQHERNPWVAEYSKRRAAGNCDLCGQEGPFRDAAGDLYLENHHIVWLAQGGEDSIANTVALCPNCHRKMHILDLESDRLKLSALNKKRELPFAP